MSEYSSGLEHESIVKNLLTSNTPLSKLCANINTLAPNSKMNKFVEIQKEQGIISIDHSYARPLNWTPESSFFQPTKILFSSQPVNKKRSNNPLTPVVQDCDDIIDVENVAAEAPEMYDKPKAMHLMGECERHAAFARVEENDDWESNISKLHWTPLQTTIFDGMVTILNTLHLARLTFVGTHHEPISRRLAIDRAVKRMRHLLCLAAWDSRMIQWLHQLLIDNLSVPYLAAYLDMLQTLKAKLPTFVDKMMYGPNSHNRTGVTSNESLFHLLKRSWDPYASNLMQNKPRKIPGNPVLVIIPSAPTMSILNKRQHKWINLLSNLGTVVTVHYNLGTSPGRVTMVSCVDQMLSATRSKLLEVKADFPGRPIVLVGLNAGSALALQVAQVDHVTCVVCLGFSVLTVEGRRGDPDDNILELQTPVLFVIGQCSNTSLQEDVEDLRERMRVETSLIIVGAADDYLRVKKKKKREEGITQSAVDRIIAENVGEFIGGLLLSPYPPHLRQSPTNIMMDGFHMMKRSKIEHKRHNSNGSSMDSEPPSPTPKITRPVGRPPGSKSKAKWAAQGIPSSPSHSSPPPSPVLSTLQHSLSSTSDNSSDTTTPKSSVTFESSKNIAGGELSNENVDDGLTKFIHQQKNTRPQGSTLSSLLQSGNRPNLFTSRHSSGIKVLENVTLNSSSSAKLLPSAAGRTVDLSKITVLNSLHSQKSAQGGVVMLPDSKLKSGSTVKGTGSTPMLFPMSGKNRMILGRQGSSKYITSKKQLISRKSSNMGHKSSILSYSTNLAPPTNLTSQDIMDLPIIFADDNQMLTDDSKLQYSDVIPVPKIMPPSNPVVGKYIRINKQMPFSTGPSMNIPSTSAMTPRRPSLSVPVRTTTQMRTTTNPVKYTKIILSHRTSGDDKSQLTASSVLSKINSLSSEISIRKIEQTATTPAPTDIDIENTLSASTIVKPGYMKAKVEEELNNLVKINRAMRMTNIDRNLNQESDSDPDYVPPMKFSKSDANDR